MTSSYRYTIDGEKLTLAEIVAKCPDVDRKLTRIRVERLGWRTWAQLQSAPVRKMGNATRRKYGMKSAIAESCGHPVFRLPCGAFGTQVALWRAAVAMGCALTRKGFADRLHKAGGTKTLAELAAP